MAISIVINHQDVQRFLHEIILRDVIESQILVKFWVPSLVNSLGSQSRVLSGWEDIQFAERVSEAVDIHRDEVLSSVDCAVQGEVDAVVS